MGAFGTALAQTAGNATGGAIGSLVSTGLGLMLEGHNDKRQISQQQKLNEVQSASEKDLANFNYGKQLDFWKATSYPEQLKQMELAGLSPGLMYGGGGGGGGTTVGAGTSAVNGASAPSGGHEIMDISNNVMQQQMMAAQIRQMNSQADKNEADAANTAGPQTNLQNTQAASLTQGITNQKTANDLMQIEKNIKGIETEFAAESYDDRLNMITTDLNRGKAMLQSEQAQGNVDAATVQEKIKILQQEAIASVLNNTLTEAKTKNTDASTQQILQAIQQDWENLKIQQQNANTNTTNAQTGQKQIGINDFNALTQRFSQNVQSQIANWQTTHPDKAHVEGGMLNAMKMKLDKILGLNY